MPHLTLQISSLGPLVDIAIGVSQARAEALRKNSLPVPTPLHLRALVDTGASITCVDPSILQQLNLTPTGAIAIHTPSTGNAPHNTYQYDISLVLLHPEVQLQIGSIPVIESQLVVQGIHALVGRDILSRCLLVYDGRAQTFALGF
jgi:predicted aspartyl protease